MRHSKPIRPAKCRMPYVAPKPPKRCVICGQRIAEVYGATYEHSLCHSHLQQRCHHTFVETFFTFRVCRYCELPEGAEPPGDDAEDESFKRDLEALRERDRSARKQS